MPVRAPGWRGCCEARVCLELANDYPFPIWTFITPVRPGGIGLQTLVGPCSAAPPSAAACSAAACSAAACSAAACSAADAIALHPHAAVHCARYEASHGRGIPSPGSNPYSKPKPMPKPKPNPKPNPNPRATSRAVRERPSGGRPSSWRPGRSWRRCARGPRGPPAAADSAARRAARARLGAARAAAGARGVRTRRARRHRGAPRGRTWPRTTTPPTTHGP